jgi:aminopeptidase N
MTRSLTRDEAVARRAQLAVGSYQVDLDLVGAEADDTFVSTVSVDFACSAAGSETWMELKAVELVSAELNGEPVEVSQWKDGRLTLRDLRESNRVVVTARMAYSRTGEGLHRYTDPEDGRVYLYSQAFLDDAPRLFACFDQPDLKATFDLLVSAPPSWTVLSNTAGEQTEPGRWRFATTQPISTYLVAVVAGPYHGVRGHHDGIDLGVWCRQSWAPYLDADRLLATTATGFDYFHELFGVRYPFGKYDQAFVPEFNAGAMENPGLVTFRDEYYLPRGTVTADDHENLANTQLHEMAHMWFGNLVTMRWWDDLWLNESFAEYLAYRAAAEAAGQPGSWTAFLVKRKAWGYRADQLSTTHPVAGEAADTNAALLNFDGISYAKGASALRQLVEWVGDDAFLTALRRHFADHAFANASLADLVGALSTASGRDVAVWADQWLRTSGPSTLALEPSTDGAGRYERVVVHQQAPERLRPHRMAVGLYDLDGDTLARRATVSAEVAAEPESDVPALHGQQVADLLLPNDGDLTYALVDLDPRSLATVREHLAGLSDPLARALVWLAVSEMVGRGTFAPSGLVELTCRALGPLDPQPVTARVVRDAITAADLWAPPAQRRTLLDALADALLHRAQAAAPGGDQQLELVRGLVEISHEPARLRDWLQGADVPDGVRVDDDLRWRLVQRLATLGELTDAEIAAERERDPSSSGVRHALRAQAAIATEQAKERAWSSAVEGGLSNHDLLAVATGFWSADQADLLAPYTERFAADYPVFAAAQSPEMVQLFGRGLFPRTAVTSATVEMADRVMSSPGMPPAAVRSVTEGRDEVLRGLRARAAEEQPAGSR